MIGNGAKDSYYLEATALIALIPCFVSIFEEWEQLLRESKRLLCRTLLKDRNETRNKSNESSCFERVRVSYAEHSFAESPEQEMLALSKHLLSFHFSTFCWEFGTGNACSLSLSKHLFIFHLISSLWNVRVVCFCYCCFSFLTCVLSNIRFVFYWLSTVVVHV
jgi:hypothetical protein